MTRAIQDEHGNWIAVDDDGNPIQESPVQAPEGLRGYSRRDSPSTSVEAGEKHDATTLMGHIYDVMLEFGDRGCIGDEVMARMGPGTKYNRVIQAVSPRYKQMLAQGMIEYTGEERPGIRHPNRKQKVRRCVPKDLWHERATQVKLAKVQGTDERILRARDAVKKLRDSMSFMCSEDKVRINYHVRLLEGILQ